MKENLIIERAVKDDAEKIIAFLNKVGGESDNLLFGKDEILITIDEEKEFIDRMNQSSKSIILLGKIDGNIVSIATLTGKARKRIAHRGEVALSVSKDYWGQGIGRNMLEELILFAKVKASLSVIELTVKADNENAFQLYKKLGFKQIGYYEKYFKIDSIYYDAYLMNLYLE